MQAPWVTSLTAALIAGGRLGWIALGTLAHAAGTSPSPDAPAAMVTKVAQLSSAAAQNPEVSYFLRLEGTIWWSNPAQGRIVLADGSGAAELQLNDQGLALEAGQRVRIEGETTIARRGPGFRLGPKDAVVDNNGVHSAVEKSGAVYLRAGKQPLRVEWFNRLDRFELEVQYEGPGLPRQRIPVTALFRKSTASAKGADAFVAGLDYRCFEGSWEVLPDFGRLAPVRTGTTADIDLRVRSRDENVAVEFSAYLDLPRDGLYRFFTRSDDGSRLFVGGPSLRLEVLGRAGWPKAGLLDAGQSLHGSIAPWAAIEGTIGFVAEHNGEWELELRSGSGRVLVEVAEDPRQLSAVSVETIGPGPDLNLARTIAPSATTALTRKLPPQAWLGRRFRAVGFCQAIYTADGVEVAGKLLVPSVRELQWVSESVEPRSESATATRLGVGGNARSELTTAAEVHRLRREEAQRAYPVRLRGVITCVLPEHQAFTIQDATRGIYVTDASSSRSAPPELGEYVEVRGTTDPSLFAPIINAQEVKCLGAGQMPEPVHPAWDQLMNGSLDAQYVELEGVLSAVRADGVTVLAREGRINLELRVAGQRTVSLESCEGALIRIRGCLFASWDYLSHKVRVGEVRIYDASVSVDQLAPADPFSLSRKTAEQLLLFDPQASALQRVKVAGQIVQARAPEYFMQDGKSGLRFIANKSASLAGGDLVEAVGFPQLSGAAPILVEAIVRKTGQAPLPAPIRLPPGGALRADLDSTRVQLEGVLIGLRKTRSDQVLELRTGSRTVIARGSGKDELAGVLPLGSQVQLTGVYVAQGWNRAVGQDLTSFEILLNSPQDILVLAKPPWWTLRRLLVMLGALACVLAASVLWITQLHRQVEERSAELETQIRERQRLEQQRALEQERGRVAQDLHDELGSGLTEISMLVARTRSASEQKRALYLEQVQGKAREMVGALDEIVWAMNPRHDSLTSLVSYLCLYTDRFLGLANVAWRFQGPPQDVECAVDSSHRHQLFLAFKEGLTNVVRHSGATDVRLSIQLENGHVTVSLADNGRGLPLGAPTAEMDGLANMGARLEKLGGRLEITSQAGAGTVLRFCVPSGQRHD